MIKVWLGLVHQGEDGGLDVNTPLTGDSAFGS